MGLVTHKRSNVSRKSEATGRCWALAALAFALLLAAAPDRASAQPRGIWGEDWDNDGRDDHFFQDNDGDGNIEEAWTDADEDGNFEERWSDLDDDGDWDRKLEDTDDDGDWDKGSRDSDGDGRFDQEWRDRNGNGCVEEREWRPIPPQPIASLDPQRQNTRSCGDWNCPHFRGDCDHAWYEAFDWYAEGPLVPQSEWQPWDGNPNVAHFFVTRARSFTWPYSVAIDGIDDAVRALNGYTSGRWELSTWVYVPQEMDDIQYFILLNTYPALEYHDWSLQVELDGASGTVEDRNSQNQLPLVKGDWSRILIEIDLDEDRQRVYYEDELLVTKSWTGGVEPGGALNIAAVDLWGAESAHSVHYDDFWIFDLRPGECPADVDESGDVGFPDVLAILAAWGPCDECPEDLDASGDVGFPDLLDVLAAWGACQDEKTEQKIRKKEVQEGENFCVYKLVQVGRGCPDGWKKDKYVCVNCPDNNKCPPKTNLISNFKLVDAEGREVGSGKWARAPAVDPPTDRCVKCDLFGDEGDRFKGYEFVE